MKRPSTTEGWGYHCDGKGRACCLRCASRVSLSPRRRRPEEAARKLNNAQTIT